MRETIGEWKEEWLATNGPTNELEVIIEKASKNDNDSYVNIDSYLYEGSFKNLPDSLRDEKVVSSSQVVESSDSRRIGAYVLKINNTVDSTP